MSLDRRPHVLGSALQRPADLVARSGGEEFAILLSDTSLARGLFKAKQNGRNRVEHGCPHQLRY